MQPPFPQSGVGPDSRRIGFTGHRHLQKPADVAAAIRSELAALRQVKGALTAISSVASGADMIFAGEVLDADIAWTALLPMATKFFREDFTPEEWARAERLMAQATEVRVLPGTERPQVYLDCGKATVDACDHLFAVWNGKPARGPGGTAEIVAYAQKMGRKITLFREGSAGVEKIDPALELRPDYGAEII